MLIFWSEMVEETPEPLSWVVIQLNFKEGQVVDMPGTQGRGEDQRSINKNLDRLGGSGEGRQKSLLQFCPETMSKMFAFGVAFPLFIQNGFARILFCHEFIWSLRYC